MGPSSPFEHSSYPGAGHMQTFSPSAIVSEAEDGQGRASRNPSLPLSHQLTRAPKETGVHVDDYGVKVAFWMFLHPPAPQPVLKLPF